MQETGKELAVSSQPMAVLARASMFWWPASARGSAWLEHLPFLFWAVESLEPQQVAVLDDREGDAFFAVCQAVERLGLNASVTNLLAPDAEHAADGLKRRAGRQYAAIARVLVKDNEVAARRFPRESVDLLLMPTGGAVDPDTDWVAAWESRLAGDGCVLVPGLLSVPGQREVFERWQGQGGNGFELKHGQGLGLVLSRPEDRAVPDMAALCELEESEVATRVVRDVFARLGQALRDAWDLERADESRQQVEERLRERESENERLRNEVDEAHALAESVEREAERRQAAVVADMEAKQTAISRERDEWVEELEQTQANLKTVSAERDLLSGELEDQKNVVEARARELAGLARMLETRETEKAELNEKISSLEAALHERDEQRADLQERLTSTQKSLEAAQATSDERSRELEQARNDLQTVTAERDRQVETLEETRKKQAELEQQMAEQQAAVQTRFQELATLTQMLAQRDATIEQLRARYEPEKTGSGGRADARPLADVEGDTESPGSARRGGPLTAPFVRARRTRALRHKAREVASSEYFDAEWYLATYPDVAETKEYARDPALHYLQYGGLEGRDPSPHFDSEAYLQANPDVQESGINPLLHYLRFGRDEARPLRP